MMPNQPINNSSYLKVVPVIGIRSEAYENVTNIVLYVNIFKHKSISLSL